MFKKNLLIALGFVFLALGAIGVAIPIMPTTPFVLLASGCFAYASPKLYNWLSQTKYFGEFIINYKTKSGVRKTVKIKALIFLYATLAVSVLLINSWHVHIVLALVAIAVTIHILMIKTKVD